MNAPPIDPMLRQLAGLTAATPDEIHAASVRARCHAVLGRRRRAEDRRNARVATSRPFETALAGGFTLAYLVLLIYDTLAVYGVV